ncbi:MAG: UDP-N-acetylmuramoyl-tripeptide--D-alanyl-D-alanine ligase [Micrococcales bacterium]|nr:UDP-N-acetylmuramoyl-tripeptide--D-alanyl-D-alanine ligase [Micrococcales bacterium]
MIPMTAAQVAAATGGQLLGLEASARAWAASIDSRQVAEGTIFVALPGERADGADYAPAAMAAGAAFCLVQRPVEAPCVLVADTTAALGALARQALATRRAAPPNITVVAVTGSAGKTTTKDLLATLTAQMGQTVAAKGSQNNHWGLPLTVLRIQANSRYLVAEMGANHLGEIAALARLAPPDVAVELGVGVAHLGEFGSVEAIAQAKAELVEGLAPGGTAVLNLDEPQTAKMAALTTGPVIGFGRGPKAQVRAQRLWTNDKGQVSLEISFDGAGKGQDQVTVNSALIGAHHANNLLAASATAWALGMAPDGIGQALDGVTAASPHRMAVTRVANGGQIIDDAYNANPASMKAALETAVSLGRSHNQPVWAALGLMGELGAAAGDHHRELGRRAAQLALDRLWVVGEAAKAILDGAAEAGMAPQALEYFAGREEAASALAAQMRQTDGTWPVVLVKGSQSAGLWHLAEYLVSQAGE